MPRCASGPDHRPICREKFGRLRLRVISGLSAELLGYLLVLLALLEVERQVSARQIVRTEAPAGAAGAILGEVLAALGLLRQVGGQIRIRAAAWDRWPDQDLFDVVGQQDAACALTRREVHDTALEALVDEIGIARIWRGLRDGRAPDFEVKQAEEVGVAGVRLLLGHRAEERLTKVDRLALRLVRRVGAYEGQNRCRVIRIADLGSAVLQRIVGCRENASVHPRVREDFGVKDVHQLHLRAAVLRDLALEHLHGAAQEGERARDREAERLHLPTRLEVREDRVVVDAEMGFGEVAVVMREGWRLLHRPRRGRDRRYGGAGCPGRRRWRRWRSRERANGAGIGDDLTAVVGQAEEYELRVGQVHMAGDGVVAARLAATR